MKYLILILGFSFSRVLPLHADDLVKNCKPEKTSQQLPLATKNVVEIEEAANAYISSSIVNTTYNTFKKNGKWQSTMGPLTTRRGGLACDNTVTGMKYHQGDYRHWYMAPSDSLTILGMKACAKSGRGEPSCSENWNLCGRKVRVTCLTPAYCGNPGDASLVSQINDKRPPSNNYLPEIFVEELTQKFGKNPKVPKSVVLYITDFCPANHSNNIQSNQCQGPQIDLSTSSYLMMAKTNKQGFINSNATVSMELLAPDDQTPPGPEY
jgi:hypothetical protein